MSKITVDDIDALLPQTQCEECGYPGCKPYAKAIHEQEADINHCPPGGVEVLVNLAQLLGRDPQPFIDDVKANTRPPATAIIREAECIGCTKCIAVCPVDAILGSGKLMHTVIEQECTGCGLCVPVCPVDCIDLQTLTDAKYDKAVARQRFQARKQRLQQSENIKQVKHQQSITTDSNKKDFIQQAIARSKAKKQRDE